MRRKQAFNMRSKVVLKESTEDWADPQYPHAIHDIVEKKTTGSCNVSHRRSVFDKKE